MDFTALQTELYARGGANLNQDSAGQTRAKQFLNDAYFEICDTFPWPFLDATSTGSGTITFTDLKQVLSVINTDIDQKLPVVDWRQLSSSAPDLTTTGTPQVAYLDGEVLKVYPASSTTNLSVRYVKFPTALSAGTDTPILPTRFHNLIVDGAMIRVLKDGDNWEAIGLARAEFNGQLGIMANSLLQRNLANPDSIDMTGGSLDDGYTAY